MSRRAAFLGSAPLILSLTGRVLFRHGPGAVPTPWEGLKAGDVVAFDLAREQDRVLLFGEAGRNKDWVSAGHGIFMFEHTGAGQFQRPARSAQ